MAKILDWTPAARAAANIRPRLVFFQLENGIERLYPITVQFMYHTNIVRNIDYDSAPRPEQWSGSWGYPATDPANDRILGSDGTFEGLPYNQLPRGTAAIRLSYSNGRYGSYTLEVIDGDVVNVTATGVISWSHRNRSWLSGRDFSLGVKNGVAVPTETSSHTISNYICNHDSHPCGHPMCKCTNQHVTHFSIPPRCNVGKPGIYIQSHTSGMYDADGGTASEHFPKRSDTIHEGVCIPGSCPDSQCTSHFYANTYPQKGGSSQGRL